MSDRTVTLQKPGGKPLVAPADILSVEIDRQIDRIPHARVVLLDGNRATGEFALSNSDELRPGEPIEIRLSHDGEKSHLVFTGIVVKHGVKAGRRGWRLELELKARAIKLTRGRKSAVFRDKSDIDIFKAIVEGAGLKCGTLEEGKTFTHAEIVQYDATDWDFMLARADVHGLVVLTDAKGEISVREMNPSSSGAVLSGGAGPAPGKGKSSLQWSGAGAGDIQDFDLEIDASHQYGAFQSFGWDIQDQERTSPSKAEDVKPPQGKLYAAAAADAVGSSTCDLVSPVPLQSEELAAWATARMARSRLAALSGHVSVSGRADIELLSEVRLQRIGKRFDGPALVTGVRHSVDHSGWRTTLQIGMSATWYSERVPLAGPPAGSLLPPVSGLQIGVVDQFEADPDKQHRVKVWLPAMDRAQGAVWARLATPDAGKERGYFFLPEPGDEVVVGFFNDDPRQPVILGSVFSSARPLPEAVGAPSGKNHRKGIVTRKGTMILFDDEEKGSITITTSQKSTIVIDENAKKNENENENENEKNVSIKLADRYGNKLLMSETGIKITTKKALILHAEEDVTIQGDNKVDVK